VQDIPRVNGVGTDPVDAQEDSNINSTSVSIVEFQTDPSVFQGPSAQELQTLVSCGSLQWLVLWGDSCSPTELHRRLQRVLRGSPLIYNQIIGVKRVIQPNDKIRFDLYVKTNIADQLVNVLRTSQTARNYGWYCRYHVHFRERTNGNNPRLDRPTRGMVLPLPRRGASGQLAVGTYNVNGLQGKRTDVRAFFQTSRLDVLGIQETLLPATHWRVSIPGASVYSTAGGRGPAIRGLSLVVHKQFSSNLVGRASPYWLFVRIMGGDLKAPMIIGTIYVPVRRHGAARRAAKRGVAAVIATLRIKFPDDPIILMGDFNETLQDLQNTMAAWPVPLTVLSNEGNAPTTRGRSGSARCIDHIAFWGIAEERIPKPTVISDWDISDHYPVTCKIPYVKALPQPSSEWIPSTSRKKRIKVKIKTQRDEISSRNYWEILAEECEDMDAQELAEEFENKCHEIATKLELHAGDEGGVKTLPRSTIGMIRRRRKRFVEWQRALHTGSSNTDYYRREYKEAQRGVSKAIRRVNRKQWHKTIALAHARLMFRPREFWNWSSTLSGWRGKNRANGIQPVYDESDRRLLTSLPDIVKAWETHYRTLASDVTGNSQNESHWSHLKQGSNPTLNLDGDINQHEVWEALGRMPLHKTPGNDGIPTDFLRAMLCEQRELEAYERLSSREKEGLDYPHPLMTKIIVRLLNLVYFEADILSKWSTSSVISIPKDGDLSDMDNYRGISLMSCVLKILLVIVSRRINVAGEDAELFHETQAGFRRKEEAVTQAACMVDVVQRRRLAGKTTYIVFVDLRKAYDTVPHEALFAKLYRFGVRGHCLRFIQNLYAQSKLSVRVGHGSMARFSELVDLLRGVRQGCPLSPVLFNIFINDLPDGLDETAVTVPAGKKEDWESSDLTVSGGLFADDVAALAEDINGCIQICDRISEWTTGNEMTVGIKKCGILEFLPNPSEEPILTETHELCDSLRINGQRVPIVQEYRYLGLLLDGHLNRETVIEDRLKKARKAAYTMAPYLRSSVVPMSMRLQVIKAVVIPQCLYGAEVFGMVRALTNKVQSLVNTLLRWLIGIVKGGNNWVPHQALWSECKIDPICAVAAGRRLRAYVKCRKLKSTIGRVFKKPMGGLRWTWMSGVQKWVARHLKQWWKEEAFQGRKNPGYFEFPEWESFIKMNPKQAGRAVQYCIALREKHIRLNNRRHAEKTKWYHTNQFWRTPLTSVRVSSHVKDVQGMALLLRARIGADRLVPDLVRQTILGENYLVQCPFCDGQVKETLYHLVFECSAWSTCRTLELGETFKDVVSILETPPRIADLQRRKEGRLSWVLGGTYGQRSLPNWSPHAPDEALVSSAEQAPEPEVTSELRSVEGSESSYLTEEESDSTETEGDQGGASGGTQCRYVAGAVNPPHSIRVGRFLRVVANKRWRRLRDLIDSSESLEVMPATATGQRPHG